MQRGRSPGGATAGAFTTGVLRVVRHNPSSKSRLNTSALILYIHDFAHVLLRRPRRSRALQAARVESR